MEIDLSEFTMEEIDAMVSAEKLRRRKEAIAELESVAARFGYSLADLTERANRIPGRPRGPLRHKRGEASEIIRHGIANGKSAKEIAAILGWKAVTGVYGTASKMGLKFPRAA